MTEQFFQETQERLIRYAKINTRSNTCCTSQTCPKAAFTTITKTDPIPTKPTKPSLSKPTGGIKDATDKGALPQHWIGTAKKQLG